MKARDGEGNGNESAKGSQGKGRRAGKRTCLLEGRDVVCAPLTKGCLGICIFLLSEGSLRQTVGGVVVGACFGVGGGGTVRALRHGRGDGREIGLARNGIQGV